MLLQKKNILQLEMLKGLILDLGAGQFSKEQELLGGSSLGQHIRHILEFYLALFPIGESGGELCYDSRERNSDIENDSEVAVAVLETIISQLDQSIFDQPKNLIVSSVAGDPMKLNTSLERELWYLYEHTTHHMAIIKIGARNLGIEVPNHFGVADSTLAYQEKKKPA